MPSVEPLCRYGPWSWPDGFVSWTNSSPSGSTKRICAVVPTAEVHSVWMFEAKLFGLTAALIVSARILYNRSRRTTR